MTIATKLRIWLFLHTNCVIQTVAVYTFERAFIFDLDLFYIFTKTLRPPNQIHTILWSFIVSKFVKYAVIPSWWNFAKDVLTNRQLIFCNWQIIHLLARFYRNRDIGTRFFTQWGSQRMTFNTLSESIPHKLILKKTSNFEPQFWIYINSHVDNLIDNSLFFHFWVIFLSILLDDGLAKIEINILVRLWHERAQLFGQLSYVLRINISHMGLNKVHCCFINDC